MTWDTTEFDQSVIPYDPKRHEPGFGSTVMDFATDALTLLPRLGMTGGLPGNPEFKAAATKANVLETPYGQHVMRSPERIRNNRLRDMLNDKDVFTQPERNRFMIQRGMGNMNPINWFLKDADEFGVDIDYDGLADYIKQTMPNMAGLVDDRVEVMNKVRANVKEIEKEADLAWKHGNKILYGMGYMGGSELSVENFALNVLVPSGLVARTMARTTRALVKSYKYSPGMIQRSSTQALINVAQTQFVIGAATELKMQLTGSMLWDDADSLMEWNRYLGNVDYSMKDVYASMIASGVFNSGLGVAGSYIGSRLIMTDFDTWQRVAGKAERSMAEDIPDSGDPFPSVDAMAIKSILYNYNGEIHNYANPLNAPFAKSPLDLEQLLNDRMREIAEAKKSGEIPAKDAEATAPDGDAPPGAAPKDTTVDPEAEAEAARIEEMEQVLAELEGIPEAERTEGHKITIEGIRKQLETAKGPIKPEAVIKAEPEPEPEAGWRETRNEEKLRDLNAKLLGISDTKSPEYAKAEAARDMEKIRQQYERPVTPKDIDDQATAVRDLDAQTGDRIDLNQDLETELGAIQQRINDAGGDDKGNKKDVTRRNNLAQQLSDGQQEHLLLEEKQQLAEAEYRRRADRVLEDLFADMEEASREKQRQDVYNNLSTDSKFSYQITEAARLKERLKADLEEALSKGDKIGNLIKKQQIELKNLKAKIGRMVSGDPNMPGLVRKQKALTEKYNTTTASKTALGIDRLKKQTKLIDAHIKKLRKEKEAWLKEPEAKDLPGIVKGMEEELAAATTTKDVDAFVKKAKERYERNEDLISGIDSQTISGEDASRLFYQKFLYRDYIDTIAVYRRDEILGKDMDRTMHHLNNNPTISRIRTQVAKDYIGDKYTREGDLITYDILLQQFKETKSKKKDAKLKTVDDTPVTNLRAEIAKEKEYADTAHAEGIRKTEDEIEQLEDELFVLSGIRDRQAEVLSKFEKAREKQRASIVESEEKLYDMIDEYYSEIGVEYEKEKPGKKEMKKRTAQELYDELYSKQRKQATGKLELEKLLVMMEEEIAKKKGKNKILRDLKTVIDGYLKWLPANTAIKAKEKKIKTLKAKKKIDEDIIENRVTNIDYRFKQEELDKVTAEQRKIMRDVDTTKEEIDDLKESLQPIEDQIQVSRNAIEAHQTQPHTIEELKKKIRDLKYTKKKKPEQKNEMKNRQIDLEGRQELNSNLQNDYEQRSMVETEIRSKEAKLADYRKQIENLENGKEAVEADDTKVEAEAEKEDQAAAKADEEKPEPTVKEQEWESTEEPSAIDQLADTVQSRIDDSKEVEQKILDKAEVDPTLDELIEKRRQKAEVLMQMHKPERRNEWSEDKIESVEKDVADMDRKISKLRSAKKPKEEEAGGTTPERKAWWDGLYDDHDPLEELLTPLDGETKEQRWDRLFKDNDLHISLYESGHIGKLDSQDRVIESVEFQKARDEMVTYLLNKTWETTSYGKKFEFKLLPEERIPTGERDESAFSMLSHTALWRKKDAEGLSKEDIKAGKLPEDDMDWVRHRVLSKISDLYPFDFKLSPETPGYKAKPEEVVAKKKDVDKTSMFEEEEVEKSDAGAAERLAGVTARAEKVKEEARAEPSYKDIEFNDESRALIQDIPQKDRPLAFGDELLDVENWRQFQEDIDKKTEKPLWDKYNKVIDWLDAELKKLRKLQVKTVETTATKATPTDRVEEQIANLTKESTKIGGKEVKLTKGQNFSGREAYDLDKITALELWTKAYDKAAKKAAALLKKPDATLREREIANWRRDQIGKILEIHKEHGYHKPVETALDQFGTDDLGTKIYLTRQNMNKLTDNPHYNYGTPEDIFDTAGWIERKQKMLLDKKDMIDKPDEWGGPTRIKSQDKMMKIVDKIIEGLDPSVKKAKKKRKVKKDKAMQMKGAEAVKTIRMEQKAEADAEPTIYKDTTELDTGTLDANGKTVRVKAGDYIKKLDETIEGLENWTGCIHGD